MLETPQRLYWRVLAKGARKAHLTEYSEDRLGPASTALCGRNVEDRVGNCAKVVAVPDGDECQKCRKESGHLKSSRFALPPEIRDIIKLSKNLARLNLSEEVRSQIIHDALDYIAATRINSASTPTGQ